jgi:DNA-binding NarL/FixJ family response regulator
MIKVLIADDQRLLRESFKNIIENNSDIKVVACAENGKEAFEFCSNYNPDVVLMDISMPVCNGTEATKLIKSKHPNIKVLVLTSSNDEIDVAEAINNGADGYILKDVSTEELILSIKSASFGLEIFQKDVFKQFSLNKNNEDSEKQKIKALKVEGIDVQLTDREINILRLIVDGKDNKEIGVALFIAEGTVKNAVTDIISKLQLKDRTQLAVYAIRNNLV